jgi:hypothetical protein
MPIKVPQNQIITKYTSGREYVIEKTNAPYKGFYCEINGKAYTGKEYISSGVSGSLPLMKITSEKYNKLLLNPNTALYGVLSGVNVKNTPIISHPKSDTDNMVDRGGELFLHFYCKKVNDILIKEIDENTYNKLKIDPLYQTTYIGSYKNKYQSIEQADTQVNGLKLFLDLLESPTPESINIDYTNLGINFDDLDLTESILDL